MNDSSVYIHETAIVEEGGIKTGKERRMTEDGGLRTEASKKVLKRVIVVL